MSVVIDHQFARFGDTRYAIDKITSFTIKTEIKRIQGTNDKPTSIVFGVLGVVGGAVTLSIGVSEKSADKVLLGLALGAGGVWMFRKALKMGYTGSYNRNLYKLILVTSAGESAAFETASYEEIERVQALLEQAMSEARR